MKEGDNLDQKRDKVANAEHVILSEQKVIVRLDPIAGHGRKILRGFSYLLGGTILRRYLSNVAVESIKGTDVEVGDIKDITDKWRKKNYDIILTNKNIVLRWRRDRFTKKDKAIAFPLEYMTSVEKKGAVSKPVCIRFEIPSERESKPIMFELKIFFSRWKWRGREKEETWMNELRRIIYKPD